LLIKIDRSESQPGKSSTPSIVIDAALGDKSLNIIQNMEGLYFEEAKSKETQ